MILGNTWAKISTHFVEMPGQGVCKLLLASHCSPRKETDALAYVLLSGLTKYCALSI
jgi:hypothetical protein